MEILLREDEKNCKVSLIAKIIGDSVPIKTVVEESTKITEKTAKNFCAQPKDQKGAELERDFAAPTFDDITFNF